MQLLRPLLGSCVLLTALCVPAAAQTTLVLPQNIDELQAMTAPDGKITCTHCGVLVNVAQQQRDAGAKRQNKPVEGGLETTTVLASNTTRKALRQARQPQMETYYRLTVRLDDGSFAFYEQDDTPTLEKGDRVEIVAGRVTLRSR